MGFDITLQIQCYFCLTLDFSHIPSFESVLLTTPGFFMPTETANLLKLLYSLYSSRFLLTFTFRPLTQANFSECLAHALFCVGAGKSPIDSNWKHLMFPIPLGNCGHFEKIEIIPSHQYHIWLKCFHKLPNFILKYMCYLAAFAIPLAQCLPQIYFMYLEYICLVQLAKWSYRSKTKLNSTPHCADKYLVEIQTFAVFHVFISLICAIQIFTIYQFIIMCSKMEFAKQHVLTVDESDLLHNFCGYQ